MSHQAEVANTIADVPPGNTTAEVANTIADVVGTGQCNSAKPARDIGGGEGG